MIRSIVIVLLGAACSGGATKPAPVASGSATTDPCVTAVDKLFAMLSRKGFNAESGQRDNAIAECRQTPNDPTATCVNAAADDAAIERCMTPAPKGEPVDQLEAATENLRTYFFVHETFTDVNVALTPAKACCQFPTKKCPPETAPNEMLTDILKLDLSTERTFQYRFESSGSKAVVEAVGDRDCDGKTITYRRELEHRADGNMHITVVDPPDGSD